MLKPRPVFDERDTSLRCVLIWRKKKKREHLLLHFQIFGKWRRAEELLSLACFSGRTFSETPVFGGVFCFFFLRL